MNEKKYGLLVIGVIFLACLLYEFICIPWDYNHVSPEILFKVQQVKTWLNK